MPSPPPSSWPGAGRLPSRGPWPRRRAASTRGRPRRPRRRVRSSSRAPRGGLPARAGHGRDADRRHGIGPVHRLPADPRRAPRLLAGGRPGRVRQRRLPAPGPPVRGRARPLPARDRRPRALPGADAALPRPGAGAEPAGPDHPALLPGRAREPARRHLPARARHGRAGRARAPRPARFDFVLAVPAEAAG